MLFKFTENFRLGDLEIYHQTGGLDFIFIFVFEEYCDNWTDVFSHNPAGLYSIIDFDLKNNWD